MKVKNIKEEYIGLFAILVFALIVVVKVILPNADNGVLERIKAGELSLYCLDKSMTFSKVNELNLKGFDETFG